MITQEQITRLLEEVGQALSRGDAKTVAEAWHVPALVLSDEGAIAVDGYPEIEAFFEKSIQCYRHVGTISAKAELGLVQTLSENLVAVDVRWLGFDEQGREKSSERSHYLLQLDAEGRSAFAWLCRAPSEAGIVSSRKVQRSAAGLATIDLR